MTQLNNALVISSSSTIAHYQGNTQPGKADSMYTLVILTILASAALLFVVLGALIPHGIIGSIGYIALTAGGETLFLFSTLGIIYIALKGCCNHKMTPPDKNHNSSRQAPSTLEETPTSQSVIEELERSFWEQHLQHKELHSLLEMAINSGLAANECANFIVDHFISYLEQEQSNVFIAKDIKQKLIDRLEKLLNHYSSQSQTKPASCQRTLPDGRSLHAFPTIGDGSCGLHALEGREVDGIYRTDAKQARKKFCNWIRKERKKKQLPQQIDNVLTDYFTHFDLAPVGFKTQKVREKWECYHAHYATLSHSEQKQKIAAFIADHDVFNTYLTNLQDTGEYLLQDELEAAAICFNKKVILHQPDWSNYNVVGSTTFNPTATQEVHIWYNGYNHYERAEIYSTPAPMTNQTNYAKKE